jgi:glycerol-3-phosphate dehydrogenase
LRERARLLQLAPQFVRPIRLFIPVERRVGGVLQAALNFFGFGRSLLGKWRDAESPNSAGRGLWLIRLGLWLYDVLSGDRRFPKHQVFRSGDPQSPPVDRRIYRWLCAYSDAQMLYPERFVVALLEDARQIARASHVGFKVLTYHTARLYGTRAELTRTAAGADEAAANADRAAVVQCEPSLVVNATGAWGDLTLQQLAVPSRRLFGGTKGSHFVTRNRRLRDAIGEDGLYAEARDGRMVFVLPFADAVLVGTTDEPFDASPDRAVASRQELEYLVQMVNQVLPDTGLKMDDVEMHYSGVRPLPFTDDAVAAAIPRGHWIERNDAGPLPVLTLIGGKLTTCRSLAEEVTDEILNRLGIARTESSRNRTIPGGEGLPADSVALEQAWTRLAREFGATRDQIEAMWPLCGTQLERVLRETIRNGEGVPFAHTIPGTSLPAAYVQWVIDNEWVTTLGDLVERRLMLVYSHRLSDECLRALAQILVAAGRLAADRVDDEVARTKLRLQTDYGKAVPPCSARFERA